MAKQNENATELLEDYAAKSAKAGELRKEVERLQKQLQRSREKAEAAEQVADAAKQKALAATE